MDCNRYNMVAGWMFSLARILFSNRQEYVSFVSGASAASAALRNSGVDSPEGEEGDQGDGVNNELVLRYSGTKWKGQQGTEVRGSIMS